ncbi:MAG: NBR1-Ig-like domain-containing protein [Candidatus Methylomirabilis sp.]|nr:NBR1-Ig-like domain-containing protein [Candidatus Methylomirabilis sp.]
MTGTAPNRELVIEWRDVRQYTCQTDSAATVKFQVVFFEESSNMLFNYADAAFGAGCAFADRGGSATVGVQVGSTSGTQFSLNTQSLNNNTALLWTILQPEITVTPTSQDFGSVTVGSSADRTFTVQNTGVGTLTGSASATTPFSILSGSPFSLGAGLSRGVVVRFSPPSAATFASNVNFTSNGGNVSRAVTGSGAPSYGATYSPGTIASLTAGQTITVPVTVTNTGSLTWGANSAFRLAYHWYQGSTLVVWDGQRTLLPQSVGPGQRLPLTATLRSPSGRGHLHPEVGHGPGGRDLVLRAGGRDGEPERCGDQCALRRDLQPRDDCIPDGRPNHHGAGDRHQHREPDVGRQQRLPPRLPLVPRQHARRMGRPTDPLAPERGPRSASSPHRHPPGPSGRGHLHPEVGHGPGGRDLVLRAGGRDGEPERCGDQCALRRDLQPRTIASLTAGQTITVPVTVTNTGSLTWGANSAFRLAYHWYQGSTLVVWDGQRTLLPQSVGPGQRLPLTATLRAPAAAGTYTLKWDMVQEGVTWFSGQGVATGSQSVVVQ